MGIALRDSRVYISFLITWVIQDPREIGRGRKPRAAHATLNEGRKRSARSARENRMKKLEIRLVAQLAVASLLGAGLTLGSLGVAAASPSATARATHARSNTIEFSGQVTAYSAATATAPGSITLTDRAGATLNFATSTTTTITPIDGSGATLAINDFATVQAPLATPGDATVISFSAAAPVSFSGVVTAYTAASDTTAGSITLRQRDGATLTYAVTSATTISENGGAGDKIAVEDFATVEAAAAAPTVALAITFDAAAPVRFDGRVTAYTPASGTTAGSITLKDSAGAELTFTTWSSTTITELDGTGDTLAVGDHATVEAAASDKSVATSITFAPAPPVEFYGQVTAYTAASGATPGSITVEKKNSSTATFSTTSSTTVTEVGGSGDALAVGDYANVLATSELPTTAHEIRFTPAPRPEYFSGRVTAYSAPTDTAAGSITLHRRDRASLTFTVTSSTTFLELGGSGDVIAVRDYARVEAAASAKTVAIAVAFRPAAPITFSGKVTAYSAASGATGGSITLTDRPGATLTFATSSSTTITELGGTGDTLVVGDHATVRAPAAAKSDATSITFSAQAPITFAGKVTAYTAASGATNGSLTLQKDNGATLTYSVTSSTTITEIGGVGGTLGAGDHAVIVALPTSSTVATTITFTVHK
jgi:hypothetical protein